MSQAIELAEKLRELVAAQGDCIFLLCEDGSQVRLRIVSGTADTQYCDTVEIETHKGADND